MRQVVRISGWEVGLKKVSVTTTIQNLTDLGLAAAKECTDRLLAGETVDVQVQGGEDARVLAGELRSLGAFASVLSDPPNKPMQADGPSGRC